MIKVKNRWKYPALSLRDSWIVFHCKNFTLKKKLLSLLLCNQFITVIIILSFWIPCEFDDLRKHVLKTNLLLSKAKGIFFWSLHLSAMHFNRLFNMFQSAKVVWMPSCILRVFFDCFAKKYSVQEQRWTNWRKYFFCEKINRVIYLCN